MVFQPDDAPPFYALDTPKYDVLVGSAGKKRKKAAGSGSSAEGNGDDAASVETHGYVGKPKGLRQVLFERGWLKPGGEIHDEGCVGQFGCRPDVVARHNHGISTGLCE